MSKQKENPGRQKLITLLFSGYMETFLFCWQWLEKYFIIKAALHGHFLMIIDLFYFYFCHWKYLNTSPVVEKLDGRKNLTYSSYLFSISYKITITNWNQQALLDVYAFHHVTVLFLEGENLVLKCSFPLAGNRRIAPQKIAPGELPNPNPNPNPTPKPPSPGAILMGVIFHGQFVEGNFPEGEGGFSCHPFGHHHIENVCVLGERESSSNQNHKRWQVKGRRREGEFGRRIARKIRVLTMENFAICVHH